MRTCLISYDLANPIAKKHAIARQIMELGTRWARPLDQTWYVHTQQATDELTQELSWLLGEEDGLIVQEIADEATLSNTTLRWFHTRAQEAANADTQAATNIVNLPSRDERLETAAADTAVAA
ncbi:MAG: hypothetical protein AAGG72_05625 [Pseudomonadota bacterium]